MIVKYEPDYLSVKGIKFERFQKNLGSTLLQKVSNNVDFFRSKQNETDIEFKYGLLKWKNR